ncbi:MAG: response regulator [Ardenticatenaceae bacterium]|nr:response regulator [Ardenticatenaceae bacterium]
MTKPLALIIDDDRQIASFFAFALESAEYETAVAFDGRSALQKLQTVEPHLIVLDMFLPDMFGGDILHQIRQNPRLLRTWVVVATGEGKAVESLVQAQADFVLTKPIDYDQIYRVCLRIRDQRRKTGKTGLL